MISYQNNCYILVFWSQHTGVGLSHVVFWKLCTKTFVFWSYALSFCLDKFESSYWCKYYIPVPVMTFILENKVEMWLNNSRDIV